MEIFAEIVFDLIIEATKSKSIPKIVRYILLSAISMIFICVMALLIYGSFVIEGGLLVRLLLLGTGMLIALFLVKLTKDAMERSEQNRNDES
jgi:fatty acid desaturase